MTTPIFSIILPIHNAARTLRATVRSILAQTITDFELIMIDDGSTDYSLPIMRSLAATDHRIKVISHKNSGVSATRNLGVELSKGQLLAFIDADDLWHPKKLERHQALHDFDADVAASYARIAFIDPDAEDHSRSITASCVRPGCLSVGDLLGENPVCTMSNLVVRRSCFDAVGPFKEAMSFAEDQEWLARAASMGFSIEGINELLVDYRLSHDGLSVDLEQMHAGWRVLAREYEQPCNLASAEALYCRYLARRALRAGAEPSQALHYAMMGLKLDPKAFLKDAKRGGLTLASALLASLLPRAARLRVFA
jgi:glycosyltransferase involved in cell wall biosynthesis